jgi:hypothetical protein
MKPNPRYIVNKPLRRWQRRRHRWPRYATRYDVRDAMFRLADIIGHVRAPWLRLEVICWQTNHPRAASILHWRCVQPLHNLEHATVTAAWRLTHADIDARTGDL